MKKFSFSKEHGKRKGLSTGHCQSAEIAQNEAADHTSAPCHSLKIEVCGRA
ncbi:hypothetical protein [Variovorax sp. JS1663]|uniref:hypothetical protein n=1 Tax=Variovorax sp. JS1663 TaxID=1851577 RepID=UPI0013024809|nr:hypothetical protein [Variovorax sp. JS1663]